MPCTLREHYFIPLLTNNKLLSSVFMLLGWSLIFVAFLMILYVHVVFRPGHWHLVNGCSDPCCVLPQLSFVVVGTHWSTCDGCKQTGKRQPFLGALFRTG